MGAKLSTHRENSNLRNNSIDENESSHTESSTENDSNHSELSANKEDPNLREDSIVNDNSIMIDHTSIARNDSLEFVTEETEIVILVCLV